MGFPYRYSRLTQELRPSPIRELFELTQRRGMISFAGGLPDPIVFPVEEVFSCAEVLQERGRIALQYGATEGYRPLVDLIRARMAPLLGREVLPQEVLITSGSQQIMDLLARVLLDPGDVVVVEAPTYPGALHVLRAAGARFALVSCDAHGMQVEKLPEIIARCQHDTGRLPKLIYSVVNFSNPSGACLSLKRRRVLAELSLTHAIPVLEDDPYGELRYSGKPIPSLFSLAEAGVIYASSFSKILAPGIRLAWLIGDAELIRKAAIVKQGSDLCSATLTQVLAAEYTQRGFLDGYLPKIREHYARKAAAMAAGLAEHLAADTATWTDPEGGFFFWLRLLHHDSQLLFDRALDEGVAFLPGPAFYPDAAETVGEPLQGSSFLRLCFTFAQPAEIAEGCRRLARALATP